MTANELQKKMNELHYLFSKSQYSTLFFVCLVSKVINLIRHFSNRSKHLCVCFYLCSPPCKMLISAEKEEHFSVLYKQSQMKNISENVRKEIRCNSGPKQFIIFPQMYLLHCDKRGECKDECHVNNNKFTCFICSS